MLPSQTVENYLKTIFLAQAANPSSQGLIPMGQIAAAVGVVPGTATTMVKALSESGLVYYEPYMGVRLTPAGEKLAGLVLRRHRLIELFLVKVLGMSWAEVHDEAERLEHAVSERLIDRIDNMLGRPAVDPHGDPIPTAEGTMARHDHVSLLDAPIDAPLVVTRVLDQDPGLPPLCRASWPDAWRVGHGGASRRGGRCGAPSGSGRRNRDDRDACRVKGARGARLTRGGARSIILSGQNYYWPTSKCQVFSPFSSESHLESHWSGWCSGGIRAAHATAATRSKTR